MQQLKAILLLYKLSLIMAKILTGIRIEADSLDKLKYIASHDRRTFTEVLAISIDEEITRWEKKNGAITPQMIAKSQKK